MADDSKSLRRLKPIRPGAGLSAGLAAILALSLCCAGPVQAQAQPANAPDQKIDPKTGLPYDYEPPRGPHPLMELEKNLLTPEERKNFKKDLQKYQSRLRNGDLRDETARTETRKGVRQRLNEMTQASNRKRLTKLRKDLTFGDLYTAGKFLQKPDLILEYRRKLLPIVVEETQNLFDNNYYVRLQAAYILGELNEVEEDVPKDIKPVAFAPAFKPLCKVLLDPEQPEDVKIACVLSLIHILHQGNPNVEQKREIALAVVSELKREDTSWWYQMRLAESLGYNDVALDLNLKPFVYDALIAVVKDPNRHLRPRVQAAWSLGRVPLDKGVNIQQTVVDITALGHELALAKNAAPALPGWQRCGWVLYLAYEKKGADDLNAKRDQKGGLLNNPAAKADANEAFKTLVPILRELIAGKSATADQVQELEKWLQQKGWKTPPNEDAPAGNHGGAPQNRAAAKPVK